MTLIAIPDWSINFGRSGNHRTMGGETNPLAKAARTRTTVKNHRDVTRRMITQLANAPARAMSHVKVAVEWDRVDAKVRKIKATWVRNANYFLLLSAFAR